MSVKALVTAAVAFVILVGACSADSEHSLSSSPGSAGTASPEPGEPGGESGGITAESTVVPAGGIHVIDGDTFDLINGDRVHVLGIDSCEMSTDMGPVAKAAASSFLSGSQVTLTTQPGVDRDQYGRMLRYVSTTSGDMGEHMVVGSHTAVEQGRSDASAERLARLRAKDRNGRTCNTPTSTSSSRPRYTPTTTSSDNDTELPAPTATETGTAREGR